MLNKHQNIIGLSGYGKGLYELHDGQAREVDYIVLELIKGGELFDLIKNIGRLDEKTARNYFK